MGRLMCLPVDREISLKRGTSVAAPFRISSTQWNFQVFPSLSYAILPLNTTRTSELHLQQTSWQLKFQKLWTLERNNLSESIPARSLLENALWKMDCYTYMVSSMSLIMKTCFEKSCMRIMTIPQPDTLGELPPINLSAEITGGQKCEKQLPDT